MLKVVLITVCVNGIVLPVYGLRIMTASAIRDIVIMGIEEMFLPTCYVAGLYLLIKRISRNWQSKVKRLIFSVGVLIPVVLASQLVWSVLFASAQSKAIHFVGFWGFYFPWTLLSCILIPVLDDLFSKGQEKTADQNA